MLFFNSQAINVEPENLADCLESAQAKTLADLNLAVHYGIVMRIYAYKKLML